MSISEVTTAAGWIAGLAIVALIAAGWRKPARATADPARARRPSRALIGLPVAERGTQLYKPAPLWKRIWALVASSVMAMVLGAVAATLIGFGIAFAVIRLTDMLKR